MAKFKVRKLNRRETQELLSQPGCVRDEVISRKALGDAFNLPDGTVLIRHEEDGTGILWESKEEVLKIVSSPPPRPRHVLSGRMPSGKDFLTTLPAILGRLSAALKLPPETLDFSRDSLQAIDRVIFREGGQETCLKDPSLFESLFAYIGEIMRRRRAGTWRLRYVPEDDVWEPWIVDSDGNQRESFLFVYEALFEPNASFFYSVW
jgi:hypothetical protein